MKKDDKDKKIQFSGINLINSKKNKYEHNFQEVSKNEQKSITGSLKNIPVVTKKLTLKDILKHKSSDQKFKNRWVKKKK